MKKKWVFVVIGLLLIVGMIGAGGKVYMDNQRDKNEINVENERIQIAQKKIALYLIRNYEDVEKIEFRNFNEMKGIGYTSCVSRVSFIIASKSTTQNTLSYSFLLSEKAQTRLYCSSIFLRLGISGLIVIRRSLSFCCSIFRYHISVSPSTTTANVGFTLRGVLRFLMESSR